MTGWRPKRRPSKPSLADCFRHLPREHGGTLTRPQNLFRIVAIRIGSLGAVDNQLTVAQDEGQQIIQLVNGSCGRRRAALFGALPSDFPLFRLHRKNNALVYYEWTENQGLT
ncbi:MAG: hypothetical protein ACLQVN_08915 [Bryobacteraceae bacterium]